MENFGDYIVYVDESGDHELRARNPEYPMFVLAFCIFKISDYANEIVPSIEEFKFKYFGHDMVVLHEREMRKETPPFDILRNSEIRDNFMLDIGRLLDSSKFSIVASAIKKDGFRNSWLSQENPYHVALKFGLERVFMELQSHGQKGKKTFVIFESRGKREDADLELEFRRILDRTGLDGMGNTLDFLCVSKQANSSGLQIADMVARPIGLQILFPDHANRAWDVIEKKMRKSPSGHMQGWGLKIYP